ncbi:membrane protein insertion efficiency factor YidD [Pirellulales bacterium]|nr:membrane protein insertion efficiency factor YidD [Pirellulales bacterium]
MMAQLWKRSWQVVQSLPARCLIGTVRAYQLTISPWLGPCCRFQPTCSEYFIMSVRRRGAVVGGWHGVRRLLRCHPWGSSGWDPP